MSTVNTVKDYVAYGLDASKPATPAVGTAASYYFATDSGRLYCWTGASWVPVGSAGSANPTATAGPVAINGTATTFLRSDGAPAIQLGSNSQKGLVQVDGTTITASGGIISASSSGIGVPTSANPSATASDTAVNGSSPNFMRADAAPAIQKCSSSLFGLAKVDNNTITAAGGVISAVAGSTLGAGFRPSYSSTQYYCGPFNTLGTAAIATGNLYATPFYVPSGFNFTKASIQLTANTGVTKATIAVYADTNGAPGALLTSTEITGISSTGIFENTGLSFTLSSGWVWLAVSCNGSGTIRSNNGALTLGLLGQTLSSTSLSTPTGTHIAWTYTSGSPPNPFGFSGTYDTGNVPFPFLRA